jgi:uncharacterized protein YdeI (YjbR/CyaY-like superfamily)
MASPSPTEPIFFEDPGAFRAWLQQNHSTATQVVAGLWRAHTGKPTISWGEGIDQALCFGWIDGVRHPLCPDSYSIRFTPRRAGSRWSQVNIEKVKALRAAGLMTPAGEAAFEARVEGGPRAYSPRMAVAFAPGQEATFRANPQAWAFFAAQAPSWRHKWTWAVSSAKSDEARGRRLAKLVDACAAGRKLM